MLLEATGFLTFLLNLDSCIKRVLDCPLYVRYIYKARTVFRALLYLLWRNTSNRLIVHYFL